MLIVVTAGSKIGE